MGNFASSAICFRDDTIDTRFACAAATKVSTDVKTSSAFSSFVRAVIQSFSTFYDEATSGFSGASVVLSDIEETWYHELVAEVDTMRRQRVARCAAVAEEEEHVPMQFLCPADTIVATISTSKFPASPVKTWSTTKTDNDDAASYTTEETDDESNCDFTDSEEEEEEEEEMDSGNSIKANVCCSRPKEVEYYRDDDDAVTKAERLLRLASLGSSSSTLPAVYVNDYLCPCGECPQYHRIACDVRSFVTWRGAKEQRSIIRVLQAFSTYNEVIGYHPEMIEAAEECLQVWLGDEDRALNSLVMLYDEVPQLCGEAA